jgi:hypothetical protein
MKSQLYNKEYKYPKSWNDDDILRFKQYYLLSKQLYPNLTEHLIEVCIEHQINEEKGLVKPIDYDKIEEIKIEHPLYEVFDSKTENTVEINA